MHNALYRRRKTNLTTQYTSETRPKKYNNINPASLPSHAPQRHARAAPAYRQNLLPTNPTHAALKYSPRNNSTHSASHTRRNPPNPPPSIEYRTCIAILSQNRPSSSLQASHSSFHPPHRLHPSTDVQPTALPSPTITRIDFPQAHRSASANQPSCCHH